MTSLTQGVAIPLFPALIAALLVAVAAVVIWIELLLREVAICAVVLFFPLALAGLVWDASRAWSRRLAEMLAALIFSKFVIVAILALASGGLASGSEVSVACWPVRRFCWSLPSRRSC
jgi:type IV secretion system protein TrbL